MQKKLEQIRKRHSLRKDAKEEPASWTTIKGNHVPLDAEGNPMGKWGERLGGNGESKDIAPRDYKLPNPDDTAKISGNSDKMTSFVLGNGRYAIEKDVLEATSYMSGSSIQQARESLKKGEYTNAWVQRAINWKQSEGLPHSERIKHYKELNEERGVTEAPKPKKEKPDVPTAKALGFNESLYKSEEAKAKQEKGRNWLVSAEKQKIVDNITKGLPKKVKTKNADYEIDHWDYVGGHFSYKGTVDGYTIGKEYYIPEKNCKGKAVSIHVYPDGKGEVNFNYNDHGVSGNYTHKF